MPAELVEFHRKKDPDLTPKDMAHLFQVSMKTMEIRLSLHD